MVWFGDAPAVDPLCASETGLDRDLTEATVTAELRAARISVVAVSIDGGLDDPGEQRGTCAPVGTAGGAGRITAATGGSVVRADNPAEVPLRLAQALGGRPVEVTPVLASCDNGLTVTVAGLPRSSPSGTVVRSTIRVSVDPDAGPGVRNCVLDWLIGGRSLGALFRQTFRVTTPTPSAGTAVLEVSPVVTNPGGVVTVRLTGFPAGADVVVDLPGSADLTVTTDASGSASAEAVILRRDMLGAQTATATSGRTRADADLIIQPRFWEPPLPTD